LICDASPLPLRAAARGDDLPDWLDLSVADDRLIAAALLLQSAHPGSALHVATSDINLRPSMPPWHSRSLTHQAWP